MTIADFTEALAQCEYETPTRPVHPAQMGAQMASTDVPSMSPGRWRRNQLDPPSEPDFLQTPTRSQVQFTLPLECVQPAAPTNPLPQPTRSVPTLLTPLQHQ